MTFPGYVPVRQLVLVDLLSLMMAVRPGERAVVALDGADGVGKTYLSTELRALATHVAGRQIVAVSMDDFHRGRQERYARGRTAQTYYRDAFDYSAFEALVLCPFRAGRDIVPAARDVYTDGEVHPRPVHTDADAVLLVDGVFLLRPELTRWWDASVFLDADLQVSVPRGNRRYPGRGPERDDPEHPDNRRYVDSHRFYREQAPQQQATWVLDNTSLAAPTLTYGAVIEPD